MPPNWRSRKLLIGCLPLSPKPTAFRNKGKIAIGYDADLILVDIDNYHPVERQDLQTKCGWSPFEGWNLTGYPVYTIVNGNIVYE